jgi:hypothetical protein
MSINTKKKTSDQLLGCGTGLSGVCPRGNPRLDMSETGFLRTREVVDNGEGILEISARIDEGNGFLPSIDLLDVRFPDV